MTSFVAAQRAILWPAIDRDRHLTAVMVAYVAAVAVFCLASGREVRLSLYTPGWFMTLATLVVGAFVWRAVVQMRAKPKRLLLTVWQDCLEKGLPRLLSALPFLAVLPFFLSAFSSQKVGIAGYGWDAAFIEADRIIHRQDAWRLIEPLVASPLATVIVNFFYNSWFFVMWGMTIWQAFSLGPHRARYLMSFVLTWIIAGTLMAHLFASVGPCFVEPIHGDPTFAPLMDHLTAANEVVPVWALTAQSYLLANYEHTTAGIGAGISAMPSVHVAIAVLTALMGWKIHRIAGIGLTFFAAMIMLGSVHLGWHYAIDGYVGGIVAWAIWWGVGYALDPARRPQAATP